MLDIQVNIPVSIVSVLLRDAMRKLGLCRRAVSVWQGVWASVTFVYCVETAKDTSIRAMRCE